MDCPLETLPTSSIKYLVLVSAIMLTSGCAVKQHGFSPLASEVGADTGNPAFIDAQQDDRLVISFDDRKEDSSSLPIAATAKCKEFLAKAELDAAVLSAPTLTASVDELGEGQVSLSYDLVNIAAINLAEKFAVARCEVNGVVAAAKALQKLTARNLSRNGAMARVNYIESKRGRFNQIRRELDSGIASETIKEKSRAKVLKVLTSLIERTNGIKSKALSQNKIDMDQLSSFVEVEQELNLAVTRQFNVKKQADYSKNVRFILSGGYTFEDGDLPTDGTVYEGFGGASLSIKLGVLSPDWQQSKSMELEAALDQLYAPAGGALWRITDTRRLNDIAASALRQKRGEVHEKVVRANNALASVSPESPVDKILAELEVYKLKAELIELDTNIRTLAKAQTILAS